MELSKLVSWARVAFPYSGGQVLEHPKQPRNSLETSALSVVTAYEMADRGKEPDDALYKLTLGLNGLGAHLGQKTETNEAARTTFSSVLQAIRASYGDPLPEHVLNAFKYAYANFKRLGGDKFAYAGAPECAFMDLTPIIECMAETAVEVPPAAIHLETGKTATDEEEPIERALEEEEPIEAHRESRRQSVWQS